MTDAPPRPYVSRVAPADASHRPYVSRVKESSRSYGLCVVCLDSYRPVGGGRYRLTTDRRTYIFTHPECMPDWNRLDEYEKTLDYYHRRG